MHQVPPSVSSVRVLRPPVVGRAVAAAFLAVWCIGALGAVVSAAVHGSPWVLVPVVVLVGAVTLGVRVVRCSVVLQSDALVIRNLGRSRVVSRKRIEGIVAGPHGQPFAGRTIYVLLTDDDDVRLDATGGFLPLANVYLERNLRVLQRWLDADPNRPLFADRVSRPLKRPPRGFLF